MGRNSHALSPAHTGGSAAHDAFLRPIHSCAGDLAKQLAREPGERLSDVFDIISTA